jgi:hypothetical protein
MKIPFPLLSALLFTTALAAADLPPWAATNPDGNPVRIAVAPPDGPRFAHLSWTKAVRTPRGTIVLAYLAGIYHGGSDCPAISRSTDGGRTFSAPQILREFAPGRDYASSGNLALGLTDDGALVVLAMAFTGDKTNMIFGWRSDDDGVTWKSVDTSALGPNKTGSIFGNILPVAGRGLVVLGHYRAGAQPYTQGIWMSASPDQGRTWGEPRRIADVPAVEPVLVQSAGRLIGFFRGNSKTLGGREFVGVSDDNGATWTTKLSDLAAADPATAGIAAPCAVEDPDHPGELLVLTNERTHRTRTPGHFWLWRGSAKTLRWQRERILLEVPHLDGDKHTDFGYPWLLHLEGRRWLMFYYHGDSHGYCPIWVTEVRL